MEIDLTKNQLMLSIDYNKYKQTLDNFKKFGLGCPTKVYGIQSDIHIEINRMGHAKAVATAKSKGLPYAVVFEDDAYPCLNCIEKFNQLISALDQAKVDWKILNLGVQGTHSDKY